MLKWKQSKYTGNDINTNTCIHKNTIGIRLMLSPNFFLVVYNNNNNNNNNKKAGAKQYTTHWCSLAIQLIGLNANNIMSVAQIVRLIMLHLERVENYQYIGKPFSESGGCIKKFRIFYLHNNMMFHSL